MDWNHPEVPIDRKGHVSQKGPKVLFDGIDCLDSEFFTPWQMASGESFP